MRKRGEQGRRKRRGIGEVKADRYSRTDQVAEARAVASALGQVLSRVGSLEPVRLVSVFASIVPSFENLRQPVLLPLAFFPASQLPARLARHPFSVFSPPIRVFLSSISFTGTLPLLLSTFFPLHALSTSSFPSPMEGGHGKTLFVIAYPTPSLKTLLEQIDTGKREKLSDFAVLLSFSSIVSIRDAESRGNF